MKYFADCFASDTGVRDGVITRLIGKWLKAGVLEDGSISYSDEGTPQGGIISPMLSNIYLHEALDKWYAEEIRPTVKGRSIIVNLNVCGRCRDRIREQRGSRESA